MIRNLSSSAKHIASLVAKASETARPVPKLNKELHDKVQLPLQHLQRVADNRFTKVHRAFNHWHNIPEEKFKCVHDIVQTCLNASVLLDDIEDGASYRYGEPVAHSVYSVALTINAAAYAYSIALENILKLGHPQALNIYSEALMDWHLGQGIEIHWRDYFQCPSEDQYIDMLYKKTATFFTLPFQLQQLFSEKYVDGLKLASLFGIYYQIRDDYCNLFNYKALDSIDENCMDKLKENCYRSDITEGKFTLPVIHALKYTEYGNQVLDILKQRTHDPILVRECVSILEELGSFQYTRKMLEGLETSIYNEINRLGDNPTMTSIMADLSDWR